MDYYTYISLPKIEMLFGQLRDAARDSLAAEVSASIGVISAKLKTNNTDRTVIRMTEAVEEYIERQFGIGTIDTPTQWVKARVLVRSVFSKNRPELFALVGQSGEHYYLIAGSTQNMIGARGHPVSVPMSYWPYLAQAILEEVHTFETERNIKKIWGPTRTEVEKDSFAVGMNRDEVAQAVKSLTRNGRGPQMEVEFLGLHLATERLKSVTGRGSVFTPLYVKQVYTGGDYA